MIQDIHPHRYDIGFAHKAPRPGDYVVALRDNQVLLAEGREQGEIPRYQGLKPFLSEPEKRLIYLFSLDDDAFFHYPEPLEEPEGFSYRDIFAFRTYQPSWMAFAAVTACHLSQWYARNRYCGVCRAPMAPKAEERALACGECGNTLYPAIAPAVIVGVADGDRLLLTRYANRGFRNYALVAGFMEVGETVEDTVRREVMEEVGVAVRNIRYYKSQPWAFSGSVLMGFFADLDGSPRLTVDTGELEEALWVPRKEIEADDSTISLTAEMIRVFRDRRHPR